MIKKNNVFRYILKKGKYAKGKYIVIHVSNKKVIKNSIDNCNYLGICVSKKNGNSVNRNKLKRWVREIYKNEEEKIKKNNNIVILFKKKCCFEEVNFNMLSEDIIECFKELNLYEKNQIIF